MSTYYLHPETFRLERLMLPVERWSEAPAEVYAQAKKASDEGIPTGIAHDDKFGWVIIMSGQGPFLAYIEHDPQLPDANSYMPSYQ